MLPHETSVRNYHYTLRNKPEARRAHLIDGGRLKSRDKCDVLLRGAERYEFGPFDQFVCNSSSNRKLTFFHQFVIGYINRHFTL
jgi:hypothetical protein